MNLFLMAHDAGSLLQANKFWIAETLRFPMSPMGIDTHTFGCHRMRESMVEWLR